MSLINVVPRGWCAAGALAALALLARPEPAHACGGCFAPQRTITSVDSHRMVIALSTTQTTLWDQIRYTGDPADFVWVLPVPSEMAAIELADQTFFEELELQTSPIVIGPNFPQPTGCAPSPPSGGAQDAAPGTADGGVTVFEEATVGPYETVIIGSDDALALQTWLVDHDYNVPASTIPVINHYVMTGSKFVVLRLAPGEDVDAMQPIRVRFPGYMATFPLKMVTVGAAGTLDMTLWIVAEQRYAALSYATLRIQESELTWDWNTFRSDYAEVMNAKIDAAGGKAWIVQYASPLAYLWFSEPEELAVASTGLKYPYVTRLQTRMLVDHIAADLTLGPAADAEQVPRQLTVTNQINTPMPQCPDWNGDGQPDLAGDLDGDSAGSSIVGCAATPGRMIGAPVALLALAGLLAIRRRRRP
jgi:MYXO-CTERM domain-containing protein